MIKYFIYCRKSSEEEERQILSIEAQLQELRDYAKQNGLFVIKEFTESRTAKEPGRPIFNQMLSEIEKGNALGILAWNPDRLARNSIDGGKVIYLVDTGKITSLKFPTFWFDTTPQGKFMLSVAFGQAKYYTDNLRENILRGNRQKIRRGEFPHKAPLGYINEPRLRTIDPDKKTFAKVRECLESFATGNFTLSTIQSKMFSLGLVGRDNKPIHLSTIGHILQNPFYYGMFYFKGELVQGSHKPMISKKLFDKIQIALRDNGKPRKNLIKKTPLFYNLARCGDCGYVITAEKKRKPSGREYIYYRCTHKSKKERCNERKFLREEELKEQIKTYCQKVSLPDEWRDKYLAKIEEWRNEQSVSSGVFVQNLRNKLNQLNTKIDRLTDGYLDGVFELVEFQTKKNKLVGEKKDIEEKLYDFERKGNHWLELLMNWIFDANQAQNLVQQENFSEMKNFLKTIGSNRLIAAGKLTINLESPYNLLYNLPAEARDRPQAIDSEVAQARGAGEGEAVKINTNTMWWR